jgi:hypothetical protein
MTISRRIAFAAIALLAAAPAASAKEWAVKMFQATTHDFGHVAHGAKAEFAFELQNLYEEDVHIADVRTSCGCTTPTVTKPTLKTWEKGTIVATFNTRSFVGQRNSTLTVVIDKPFYAEVPLTITGYIHSDVDFQPGTVGFGDVEQGAPAEQEIQVTYRGRANWQIADVRSANPHLEVELSEPGRQPGLVSYKMLVRLKPRAPAGTLTDQLTIVTNDQRLPTVALSVEGRVMPPLSVNPSPLLFGTLAAGQTATKQLVITGKQPFKVLSITADHEALQFKSSPEVVKKVHLVPVTISAPSVLGDFQHTVTIDTDLPSGGKVTLAVRGTVRSAGGGSEPTTARPSFGGQSR